MAASSSPVHQTINLQLIAYSHLRLTFYISCNLELHHIEFAVCLQCQLSRRINDNNYILSNNTDIYLF